VFLRLLTQLDAKTRTLSPARDERGVSAVILAILMTTLLAFAAIALDYSMHVATKVEMQNVVDEAAVAAATACQDINPASSRPVNCGQAAATSVVQAVQPGATVTTELVSGTVEGDPVQVSVYATTEEGNVLQSEEAGIGPTSKIGASSLGQARTLPVNDRSETGASRCSRSVDTGLGVSQNGDAYAWGYLYSLGGVAISGGTKKAPQRVPLDEGTIVSIAGQIYDANALDVNGHVWGWGTYDFRNGTDASRPSNAPEMIRKGTAWNGSGALLDKVEVLCDTEQAGAALDSDGKVWVWGYDLYGGNTGNGASVLPGLPDSSTASNKPVWLKGAYNNFFVMLTNGDIYYAGGNSSLPPGNPTSYDKWTKVTGLETWTASTAAAGSPHIITIDGGINMGGAVLSNGQVLSWSYANTKSRTGRNGTGVAVVPGLSNIKSQQFGYTGVIMQDSDSYLWGYGASDDYGNLPQSPTQVDTQKAVQYAAGQGYYLWERTDGTWWGRGYNPQGSLGVPTGTRTVNTQILFNGVNSLSVITRT
jgi:Flp pilus assembly protein TadG/alpha-tubulin suppressor-like RCC1 family protein